jgi:hypothetical protein
MRRLFAANGLAESLFGVFAHSVHKLLSVWVP